MGFKLHERPYAANDISSRPIKYTRTGLGNDKLGRVAKTDIVKLISSHNT